jgi:hypothetical protein
VSVAIVFLVRVSVAHLAATLRSLAGSGGPEQLSGSGSDEVAIPVGDDSADPILERGSGIATNMAVPFRSVAHDLAIGRLASR